MVKGIIDAFDHMKLCLVIHLTKGGNWIIPRPPIFATGYVSFATTFNTRLQVLAPCKKLISNNANNDYYCKTNLQLLANASSYYPLSHSTKYLTNTLT